MPAKNQKKRRTCITPTRTSEVLDVKMTAELLTVLPDTVYDLFKRGELPGRKVGRTKSVAHKRGLFEAFLKVATIKVPVHGGSQAAIAK
jgi:hypothetical protein